MSTWCHHLLFCKWNKGYYEISKLSIQLNLKDLGDKHIHQSLTLSCSLEMIMSFRGAIFLIIFSVTAAEVEVIRNKKVNAQSKKVTLISFIVFNWFLRELFLRVISFFFFFCSCFISTKRNLHTHIYISMWERKFTKHKREFQNKLKKLY